ncbi:hypothetical protein D3C86_1763060 [compost metagenome]
MSHAVAERLRLRTGVVAAEGYEVCTHAGVRYGFLPETCQPRFIFRCILFRRILVLVIPLTGDSQVGLLVIGQGIRTVLQLTRTGHRSIQKNVA